MPVKDPVPDLNMRPLPRPQDALLSDMNLPLTGTYFPLGFPIRIYTNRREVLDAAEMSFGHTQRRDEGALIEIRVGVCDCESNEVPPAPTRREYNHLYLMTADTENQAVLDLRSGENFVWLTNAALKDLLYLRHNFLEKIVYLLLGASVVTDIHAGCVSKKGKGILFCGDSGAGKSTLSYACARSGWTFTSDDTCYLLNAVDTPRVIGHAHRVRFRPAARDLFPELEKYAVISRMEGKPSIEVPVSELPIADTSPEVDVCAVIYLRRSPFAERRLNLLPPGTATRFIAEELFSAGEIRLRHIEMLQKLDSIPTYEFHYSDLDEAISELDRLVDLL